MSRSGNDLKILFTMKKLLLFMFAVVAFAACEQAPIEEQSAVRQDAPETITVGFEGDDTRIQLNEAQKTVWTESDQVSVFYKSYDNLKFEFEGNTGDRNGTLKRVGGQHNGQTMDDVVVVYPYSADYMITLSEGCVNATIPSTQTYLKGSYGVGDNLMIARSSFNQFSLKSVCGWLKIQLTGAGKVIERITFRGNDDEQVAGLVYVDATTAEATLATAKHNSDDNSQLDGTLVLDDSIYTEVTLDCGEGVTLGAEATAFYIALLPQTFEEGFTVDIECDGYKPMTLSTTNTLTIERNHIQPMASVEHDASPIVPNNEIWYTSSDGNVVDPYKTDVFGANIISNEYNNGMGVITFDGDVTSIGNYAFIRCYNLKSVTIPDSVTTIGYQAFYNCDSLTSVNIPDSVTTIGDWAFAACYRLTSVNIPDSVTTIGNSAFCYCNSLTEFTGKFAEDNGRILVVDGVLTAFAPAGITEYTIPDSVATIGESAFAGCDSLTSVTIPDSVTTIGSYAFYSCNSLKEFKGKYATEDGRSLIVDNTIIAYANASGTTYTIPDSVTEIGRSAFENCNSLTSVNIPDSVTKIGDRAFYNCYSLTSVDIHDSVTTIGNEAFSACSSLTSVTIPDSVTTIGWNAFNWCTSLTSVNIPDSVKTIGNYAFSSCTSLTSVYCKATTPPALGGTYVFDNNVSGRKIYVPAGSVEAYKSATRWSEYASAIVGYDFENGVVVE